jgi:hypothetical protein
MLLGDARPVPDMTLNITSLPVFRPMIADTNPWAAAARQVAALAHRRAGSDRTPVNPDLIADAMWVLVWLAGERVAPPHQILAGGDGTIQMEWNQGHDGFEVRVLAPGRLSWRANGESDGARRTGRKLDRDAAGLLRSLIPLTRPFRGERGS